MYGMVSPSHNLNDVNLNDVADESFENYGLK